MARESMQWTDGPRSREKGAFLYIVGASLFVLLGFLGLAFDLGHMYNNKSELQNIADAAALSGATALNGTSAGIQLATDRARDLNSRLDNKTEFNNTGVTLADANVSFSAALNGTYINSTAAQASPADIKFVRVVLPPQTTEIFFAKVIPGVPGSSTFGAEAVAGQTPVIKACNGLDPFSPAPISTVDPHFGYIANEIYYAELAVFPAGCDPTTPCFLDTLLNSATGDCISIGGSLPTTTTGMGVGAVTILKARFLQDTNAEPHATYDAYLAATPKGNNRRVIKVAFNNGGTVAGFGCFFMNMIPDDSSSTIGMQYVGSCDIGAGGKTVGNSASLTKIVLFR